ncbi:alpha/beta fold hydrolase [Sphingopyxis sp. RIFCSPHIGHO2_12_FULL_65_19]|uniref:alpha/beta fold hydrolase n=1 Tax=Sphingopyxis sp. RIFCSPHIGHO2_12_FULL_65_19 TaxID=1802172 RepID=UPI0008C5143E|nr:alpha/beta hydrolase [Sphingopyxis sp. RIFCSPHIGHO2_12_FULL_65_19]OHD08923.1 MAG: alpha/beta hydrolase [Sphingopyxis sp. RIFCSPHIGHO2_12_FULL_65_19]
MTAKLFIHGVPDSPAIWRPLLAALDLGDTPVAVPALPGFTGPLPAGFSATKEAYADWAVEQAEALFAVHGAIDIVGHDWGALIAQRVAMLRPDLLRSWAISNAVIDPDYRGHRLARIWNTPILGEIFMALSKPAKLAEGLAAQGMPADIAAEEAAQWANRDKRRAILKLYRSAKGLSFAHDWALDIPRLPANGTLIWGAGDPYVALSVAQRFAANTGMPLAVIGGAGHWAIAERPTDVAAALHDFWNGL